LSPIYLDTHVVIWLGQKKQGKLSRKAKSLIEHNEICVPAMVELELQVLNEIGKIKVIPAEILASLRDILMPQLSMRPFFDICDKAKSLSWTRDLFDRLIVAEAACAGNAPLITADANIHAHYKKAVW